MRRLVFVGLFGLALLLAGCGGEPTPFPVNLPTTPTPMPTGTPLPALHYGLDLNTSGLVADMALLEASAQVEVLSVSADPNDLNSRFDVIAAYGAADLWTLSPVRPQVGLIVNPSTLSPEIAALILSGVAGQVMVDYLPFAGATALDQQEALSAETVRNAFANLGQPDGLDALLGVTYVPGAEVAQAQLTAMNVRVRPQIMTAAEARSALESGRLSLALVSWMDADGQSAWESLFGAEYLRPLYSVPIRYLAAEGLTITFTPGGWPIASRTP